MLVLLFASNLNKSCLLIYVLSVATTDGVYPESIFGVGQNVSLRMVVNNSEGLRKHFIFVGAFLVGWAFFLICGFFFGMTLVDFLRIGGRFVRGRMACLSRNGRDRIVLIMARHFPTASGSSVIASATDELDIRTGVDRVSWRVLGGEDTVSNNGRGSSLHFAP